MRIAFIVDMFPKISETFILDQITGLIDLGHSVEIFAGAESNESEKHPEIDRYDLFSHIHYFNTVPDNLAYRLLKGCGYLVRVILKSPCGFLRWMKILARGRHSGALSCLYWVNSFLREGDFDIIQCHFGHNGNIGAALKEFGISGKLVTMFHGYDLRQAMRCGGQIYLKLFETGDCFLSISDFTTRHLIDFGAPLDKIVYHPVGIDPTRFSFRWADKTKKFSAPVRVLTVARLVKEKGLACGITAIARLVRRNPELTIEYHIIGNGPLEQELKRVAAQAGVADRVCFKGLQSSIGVRRALREAHIFFLPSRAEVLPVVLMEAMATGLPAVAAAVGGVSELIKDNISGFLVPVGDDSAMATKLEFLIRNPERWFSMGEAGHLHIVKNFNNIELKVRLESIYTDLLSLNG